jgi:multiple sugar transport system permease protein
MALGVFAFSEAWANFIWPLVVVTTKVMYTTELGLATYQRQFYIEYGPISAGAVISILPMLVVFSLLRRHIMKGIATTGLRGDRHHWQRRKMIVFPCGNFSSM